MFAVGPITLAARIHPLAIMLRSLNVDCNVVGPINWDRIVKGKIASIFSSILSNSPKECIKAIQDPPDVLIISKASTPQIRLLQSILKHKKTKVIFDLTDAIFLPTASLFGVKLKDSFLIEKIIRNSDFVTVNGHYLLRYVQSLNTNATIIHDPVDTTLFSPSSKNHSDKITIGWEGVPHNHYPSLALLKKALRRIAKEYDIRFKIVSYLGDFKVKEIFRELEGSMKIDYGSKKWTPLNKLPEEISDFDVMVAPLPKTLWYEGKSALRVGLGMSMGVPVVASPVGEQKFVIKHKVNGFLAQNDEEWYKCLKVLIEDDKLRREIGRKGRETAERELSLSVCGNKLLKIIAEQVAFQKILL